MQAGDNLGLGQRKSGVSVEGADSMINCAGGCHCEANILCMFVCMYILLV